MYPDRYRDDATEDEQKTKPRLTGWAGMTIKNFFYECF
jgi:hypothetical protein